MLRFISLALLAAYAADVVLAAPQSRTTSSLICDGYMWGVMIVDLATFGNITVYNQYVTTTNCTGPAWVQSSTSTVPPTSISPWGTTYECEVPQTQYYCSGTPVATCCGKLA